MNIEKIKNLRDSTGLSFNEIRKALDETGGDEQRAREPAKPKKELLFHISTALVKLVQWWSFCAKPILLPEI